MSEKTFKMVLGMTIHPAAEPDRIDAALDMTLWVDGGRKLFDSGPARYFGLHPQQCERIRQEFFGDLAVGQPIEPLRRVEVTFSGLDRLGMLSAERKVLEAFLRLNAWGVELVEAEATPAAKSK